MGSPRVIRTTTPRARREHTCQACLQPIKRGERHACMTNVDGGSLYDWREHIECRAIAAHLDGTDYDYDGYPEGWLYEEITSGCPMPDTLSDAERARWDAVVSDTEQEREE